MTTPQLDDVFGTPNERTTHWGISRKAPRGNQNRLIYNDAQGTGRREWPLSELSLETIRERWGAGEYRVHWLAEDPDAPEAGRQGVGQSPWINLAPLPSAPEPEPAPMAASTDPTLSMLQFAERLISMSDARASRQVESLASLAGLGQQHAAAAPARAAEPGSDVVAQLRAEIAGLRAEADARERRQELENRHRAELAERDRQIAELRQQAREREREDDTPIVQPSDDAGIVGQAVAAGVNAAMQNPKATMTILSTLLAPVLERVMAAQAQPQPHTIIMPPVQPSMPAPMPPPPPVPAPPPSPPSPVSVNAAMPQQPIGQVPVVQPNGTAVTP